MRASDTPSQLRPPHMHVGHPQMLTIYVTKPAPPKCMHLENMLQKKPTTNKQRTQYLPLASNGPHIGGTQDT